MAAKKQTPKRSGLSMLVDPSSGHEASARKAPKALKSKNGGDRYKPKHSPGKAFADLVEFWVQLRALKFPTSPIDVSLAYDFADAIEAWVAGKSQTLDKALGLLTRPGRPKTATAKHKARALDTLERRISGETVQSIFESYEKDPRDQQRIYKKHAVYTKADVLIRRLENKDRIKEAAKAERAERIRVLLEGGLSWAEIEADPDLDIGKFVLRHLRRGARPKSAKRKPKKRLPDVTYKGEPCQNGYWEQTDDKQMTFVCADPTCSVHAR